ncbi:alkylphosphocholine resistance protein lem3 [Diatrype stigma]|uniref:Alkylphosphocholine resistance protein lem3 n=1 Tax=Diatrype stigma TaxID=117547 RepID=A0AAN9URH4_9PEZI
MADDTPPDSIDQSKEKKKSRRPANTAFRQQRLKAWQPILTPKTVIPLFFAIGIICAPIGGLLIWASTSVKYFSIDYTNCFSSAPEDAPGPVDKSLIESAFDDNGTVKATWQRFTNISHDYDGYTVPELTRCVLNFTTPASLKAPVLFYYSLQNFYQNHRRYVQSFYDSQLLGNPVTVADVEGSLCEPLETDEAGRAYYPCGLIANSMFNDTYSPLVLLNVPGESNFQDRAINNATYIMTSEGIAWDSDKELYKKTQITDYDTIVPPKYWQIRYPNGRYTTEHPPPDIGADEHFMVWMRTAGLPDFSKLYARNNTHPLVPDFRSEVYSGKKRILFTELSVMGGHNNFLGILWLVVGGFCILLAVVFLITNFIKPRKLGDHTYLSWNNAPPSAAAKGKGKASGPSTAAMASGRDI